MSLRTLTEISTAIGFLKKISIFSILASVVISVASIAFATYQIRKASKQLYLLDTNGAAFSAKQSEYVHRKPEIINHIRNFHDLFYGVDQFNYETRVNDALYLIGNSGKDLYLTLKASGWYSKLVSNNLSQSIHEDSLIVYDNVYPYVARYYGRVTVSRTDLQAKETKRIQSTFILHNVSRTEKNPHGLLIENYLVKQYD
jgi:hypothetical protein